MAPVCPARRLYFVLIRNKGSRKNDPRSISDDNRPSCQAVGRAHLTNVFVQELSRWNCTFKCPSQTDMWQSLPSVCPFGVCFFFFTPVMTLKFGIDPLLAIKDKWLRAIDWIHSFKCSLCSVLIWGFRIDVSGGRCLKCSSICDSQQEWTEWQLLWPPQVAEGQAVLMI